MGGAVQRIEFLETLGRGGFGSVYLADVTRPNRFVQRLAIKVLSADLKDDADLVARQRDEARLLAQLNHDHIVKVMDLTEIHGRPALIMEYVEGADCGSLLRDGALPARAALEIIRGTASALSAAWTTPCTQTGRPLRVIHRDIKPSNLLISRHGGLKVLDFGIARADFDREGRTTSVQYGTARYMAPEQWLFGGLGHEVDVFALGVSAIEMLSGRKVERLPLEATAYLNARSDRVEAPDLQDQDSGVVGELRQLLMDMLAFVPAERPSASQVQVRCDALMDRLRGQTLADVARDRIPELIVKRKQQYLREPVLTAFIPSVDEPDVEIQGFPQVQTELDGEPGSEDTLARATKRAPIPSLWVAAALSLGVVLALAIFLVYSGSQKSSKRRDRDSDRKERSSQEARDASDEPASAPGPDPEDPVETSRSQATTAAPQQASSPHPSSSESTAEGAPRAGEDDLIPEPMPPPVDSARESLEITRTSVQLAPVPLILNSDPWGAQVWVQGQSLGHTPILDLKIGPGSYTVIFELGDQRESHQIRVLEGRSNHFKWNALVNEIITIEDQIR